MAYFERTGLRTFRATEHVGGAWDLETQHIAPALGLLAHAVEVDRDARRPDGLSVSRLSYDILGTLPVDVVEVDVQVVRPGRTIELVHATLSHDGRPAVLLRSWLLQTRDTAGLAGTTLPAIRPPDDLPAWEPSALWPGGFIASVEVRRDSPGPGRAAFWVRSHEPLVEGEEVSRLARAAGLLDIANGMAVRADPADVAFPNVDLTAHLFDEPRGDWVGFDTHASFGPAGIGLTHSVVHDTGGPLGTVSQLLTVRPR